MRRADRLFQIIQSLRRRRHPTTAKHLADELEISVRTVYRDIADLASCGVPFEGGVHLAFPQNHPTAFVRGYPECIHEH